MATPKGPTGKKGQRFDPLVSRSALVKFGLAAALAGGVYNVVSDFFHSARNLVGGRPDQVDTAVNEAINPARPVADTTTIVVKGRTPTPNP